MYVVGFHYRALQWKLNAWTGYVSVDREIIWRSKLPEDGVLGCARIQLCVFLVSLKLAGRRFRSATF